MPSAHPGVQKKAQAEVDTGVGPDRIPEFTHGTIADDELRGYFIPAGTVLLTNILACMHNPTVYEDPEVFRPERFIREGRLDPSVQDPVSFVFVFGQRVCPGRHFALASLFINVASILHGFNITPPLDEDGHPITIHHSQTIGLISYPEDCRCIIKPHLAEAAALTLASANAVV